MEQLLKRIIQLYNLTDILEYKPMKTGVGSQNHVLETENNKYFLKSYRKTDEEKVKIIHRAINFFYENQIPAIKPIKQTNGDDYFVHEEQLFALFPFENGHTVTRQSLNIDQSKSLGEVLAKMNLATQNGIPEEFNSLIKPVKDLNTRKDKVEKVKEHILGLTNPDEFDRYVLKLIDLKQELINKHWEEYSKISLPINCLIHGDFHCQNVLFEGDFVKHILDFDNARCDSREEELVRCMNLTFFEYNFEEKNFESARAFLETYNNLYPITFDNFVKANKLFYFGQFRSVWAEEWYYFNNNLRVKPIIENNYDRLLFLSENFADTTIRFQNIFE